MATAEAEVPQLEQEPVAPLQAEVPMSDEERTKLVNYLDEELGSAEFDRKAFIDRMIELNEVYRTPKPTTEKTFPFKRASQITMPVAKMTVNVLAPRITDELERPDPPWSIRSSHEEEIFERVSKHVEDFLALYAKRRINLGHKIEDMILEGCKLGTAAWEVVMDPYVRQSARYSPDGLTIELFSDTSHVGPQIRVIPIEDLWWKFGFTDIQQMCWIGKELHFTKREVQDRIDTKRWREEEGNKVLESGGDTIVDTTTRRLTEEKEKAEKTQPSIGTTTMYHVHELYLWWPITIGKKTVTADLLLWYHRKSRSLLRVQLNPWWHGRRPILVWQYTPVEHRLVGEGIAEQVEQFQAEITAMHRLRLDNATLANMRMIIIGSGVQGLGPGEPLYPGKVIKAKSAQDIQPFQLTEVYPSTVTNESLSLAFVERVTGINEATLGRALPVTRTTATAQISLLEEQNKRFNLTIRRARRLVEEAGEMVYDLFHQFGTGGLAEDWLGPTRGRIVETLFTYPRERVTSGLSVRIVATSARVNKQIEQQANLQLFNLMVQLHTQLLQLVQGFAPQTLPLVARGLVTSAKKFMVRVLESFDVHDPEDVLQALALMERVLPAPEGMGGQATLERQLEELQAQIAGITPELRGTLGADFAAQLGGVEDTLRQIGRANGGRAGLLAGSPVAGGVPV